MDAIADSAFFSPLSHATRLYIVRHGQSEGNAKGIFQGRLDMPLDAGGRSQARDLGVWLAREGVGTILSSPLARAAETARIVGEACATEPLLEASFAEIDTGIFTGLSFEQARRLHPEVYSDFEGRSWEAVPGAERAEALYGRAMTAWTVLRARALAAEGSARDGAIAVISHGGFIQWLVRSTFGGRSWMPLLSTANCGVFELLVEPRGEGRSYLQWKRINFQAPPVSPAPSAPVTAAPEPATPASAAPLAAKAAHSGSA